MRSKTFFLTLKIILFRIFFLHEYERNPHTNKKTGCRDRDRMVVGFTTTYAIIAYHH